MQISSLSDSPDPAYRGGQITYTISVENNGDGTSLNADFEMDLPANTTFVSVTDDLTGSACSHDAGTPGTVDCSFGNLLGTGSGGPSIEIVIVIETTAGTAGVIDVDPVVGSDSADSNPANNTANQNSTVYDGADLSIAMSDSPPDVIAGANVTYTIDVTNNGPNDASTISLTDTLPTSMTYVSASGTGWTCNDTVNCTRASIANGVTAPTITLVAQVTGATSGNVANIATVSAATGDPAPNNNTLTENTNILAGADLSITKVASTVLASSTASFTLSPRNAGPFAASTVTVADTLPTGFTSISATGSGWSCGISSQTVTCTRSSYSVGAEKDITISATSPASGTNIDNTAAINATTSDPDTGNNSDTINFNIMTSGSDLRINKGKTSFVIPANTTWYNGSVVAQGATMTTRVQVMNQGPDTTTGVITVTDTLSAGETYSSYGGTNWACTHSGGATPAVTPGGTVTCQYASTRVALQWAHQLYIYTVATGAGAMTNTACTEDVGGQSDGNSSNNCDSGDITSTGLKADIVTTKSATTADSNTTLSATENTITYTINVTNNGPDSATDITVTDSIPGYVAGSTTVTVVSKPSNYNCSAGTSVNCTQQSGSLANGNTDQFVISVTRPLYDGTLTNTATAYSGDIGDPDRTTSSNEATATVTVTPVADVKMQTKSVTPSSVQAGVEATYILEFTNNETSTATGVVVTDDFNTPGGGDTDFTLVSATTTEGTCSYNSGTKILTCSGYTLSPGEDRAITVIIRPNWQVTETTRTINNTATISTTTYDNNSGNDSVSQSLTVVPSSIDMLVNNDDLMDPLGYYAADPSGNVVTYNVQITNSGPSLATGMVLTDVMTPKNGKTLTFLGDKPISGGSDYSGAVCNNVGTSVTGPSTLTMTCNLSGTLAATASVSRYLDFQVMSAPDSAGDTHNNAATIAVNEIDAQSGNNSESEATTVRKRVDLSVTKSPSSATVQLRQPFSWGITVTNNGPADSTVTTLTDTLPSGMEFSGAAPSWTTNNATPTSGTCSTSGSTLTCNLSLLEALKAATITVPVRVTAYPGGGTTENCATATTNEADPVSGNNDSECGTVTVQKSSISGFVYTDTSDEGVKDVGETGIQSITINLTGTDAYGNAVSNSTSTASDGSYTFDDLTSSDGSGYTVTEPTQPAGKLDGLDNAGGATTATVIANSMITDTITGIALSANTALTNYNFGELLNRNISITGYVWYDEDDDGVRDSSETTGIENVTLTLSGSASATTTTDANGAYSFTSLAAGTYTVTETAPSGWVPGKAAAGTGTTTAGTADNASGSATYGNVISGIVVNTNDFGVEYDFGEGGGSLAGKVYYDLDNSGTKESNEPGIPSVTITLTGTDTDGTSISRSTTTDDAGIYTFSGLPMPNGSGYTITETEPSNYNDGTNAIGTLGGTIGSQTGNDTLTGITFASAGSNGTGYNFAEITDPGNTPTASISGRVWLDLDSGDDFDAGQDTGQSGWTVELVKRTAQNDTSTDLENTSQYTVVATTSTDANGNYTLTGLIPGNRYEIRFRHPSGGYIYGNTVSVGSKGSTNYGTIRDITLADGDAITEQNLPLDPSGVVYDSVTRAAVPGAIVTLSATPPGFVAATDLVGGASSMSQTTDASGLYQFLFFSSAPDGSAGTPYTLTVTAPAGYLPGESVSIPACTNIFTSEASPPGPTVSKIQALATPPAAGITLHNPAACPTTSSALNGVNQATTQYFFSFILTFPPGASSVDVVYNHIPLDPASTGTITATKTTPLKYVSVSDLVPYTMTFTNTLASALSNIDIKDIMPPGFKYKTGSATLDSVAAEPGANGRTLTWTDVAFAANQTRTFKIMLIVGTGVSEGRYTNQTWAENNLTGVKVSNVATAVVQVVPDPTFDCSDLIGKVFDDLNVNGYQDEGEPGIANVRVATVRGLLVTTDPYGRFHVACPEVPHMDRGSNFIMKLDERSLPSGYRVTTENPRVVRLTRGKLTGLNFGASIHGVVRLDLNTEAFETDTTDLKENYLCKLDAVTEVLKERPSVLRISYIRGPDEPEDQARKRLEFVTKDLRSRWHDEDCCYALIVETELVLQSEGGAK